MVMYMYIIKYVSIKNTSKTLLKLVLNKRFVMTMMPYVLWNVFLITYTFPFS